MNKLTMLPLLTLLTAGTAMAQTNPTPNGAPTVSSRAQLRHEVRAQEMDALVAKLGLDPAAATNLKATMGRFRAQAMPLRQSARQTRRALKEELQSGSPNQARVASLTTQLLNDRSQLRAIGQERLDSLKGQLTPTQFATLIVSRREMGRQYRHDMRKSMKGGFTPEE